MQWSHEQDKALIEINRWYSKGSEQLFRLFGYAGTGKTTLARHIADGIDGDVAFGAFTGKAAHVLRQKGCHGASTIHAMIYRPRGADEEKELLFAINRNSPAAESDLIIIDECSMVDEELGRDLLSFGKKVLVLGDPAQLPPVKGGGFFTETEPDMMLTEVHRQAKDNPIIRLSMDIRMGKEIPIGDYGAAKVIHRKDIAADAILACDQVLVGMNKTRRLYNQRIRQLLGYRNPLPAVGEKLVCLRNDKQKGLLNGGMWTIGRIKDPSRGFLRMVVAPEENLAKRAVSIKVLPEFFTDSEEAIPYQKRRSSDEFVYGYALTVHKAQGSQWDDIILFDESGAFRDNKTRWLYTGVTRAAKTLTIVR